MSWVIAILVIAAIAFGIWLWDKLVDGVAEIAFAAALWPFAKLIGLSATNHAVTVLRTPQRFQLAASPDQVAHTLTSLPGVLAVPPNGTAATFYRDVQPGRIILGVGNDSACHYDIEIRFVDGWPGTCGELRFLSWKRDPIDEMQIHHVLLDNVFQSLRALDSELYVTTGALTPAPVGPDGVAHPPALPPSASGPPPPIRLGPAWPGTRTVNATGIAHSIPVIPAAAIGIFVVALVVGSCSALGVFHTTTRSELCSAYQHATSQFGATSFSTDEGFDQAMDNVDMTDELKALKDRADSYDDDGVKKDADNIDDLDGMFSQSSFDSATSHIAAIC